MDSISYHSLIKNGLSINGLSYEFTRNKEWLSQYFLIREKIYTETFKLKDFSTHIDGYDSHKSTDILIVRSGNVVIGGSRVTIHYPQASVRLPMETDDFILSDIFPHVDLKHKAYTEISRMVLLPEFRSDRRIASIMFWNQFALAVSEGCEYMFSITPAVQNRNNRLHFQKLGYEMKNCEEVIIPDKPAYEGRKMHLAITEIKDKMPIFPLPLEETFAGVKKLIAA